MKVYTLQDSSKSIVAVTASQNDAVAAAKHLKLQKPRSQFMVYEYEVVTTVVYFYQGRKCFDTREAS